MRAPKQEQECASKIGGRVTKQSGAGKYEKGDVRLKDLLRIECKTTGNKSFSVTVDIIDKIEDAACAGGELPVIEVEFNLYGKTVYVVPEWALQSLIEEANKNGSNV